MVNVITGILVECCHRRERSFWVQANRAGFTEGLNPLKRPTFEGLRNDSRKGKTVGSAGDCGCIRAEALERLCVCSGGQ